MKYTKVIALSLIAILLLACIAGCGTNKGGESQADGKVTITIGNWPDDTKPEELEIAEKRLKAFNEKYPDVIVKRDTSDYDVKTFIAKAGSGQLPTIYGTFFTEIDKIINAGYAADITSAMRQYGYDTDINPDLLELCSRDGKIYALPVDCYAQGLFVNEELFERAGLLDDNGGVIFPETYEELGRIAKIIKDKTGVAGFVLPATNNCGGWHFMNIGWAYGVQFMAQEDGKWVSKLDSPEAVAALQYIKDLKWEYGVLPENVFIDKEEMEKLFATGQAAMCILDPPGANLTKQYKMDKDSITVGRMPAGPVNRYSQMGGNVRMIAPNATPEQIEAVFNWLEFEGITPIISEQTIISWEDAYKLDFDTGNIVLDQNPFKVWINPERVSAENDVRAKYLNIDPAKFESYYSFEDVIIRPEEPVACQDLYSLLDSCIQEVLTNKDADPAEIIKKASEDFQKNYLDKVEE